MPKKELSVEDWKEEIDRGLEYRRKYGLEDSWAELEALFYQVHNTSVLAGPNLIASTGDSFLAALSVPYPYMMISAARKQSVEAARIIESVDNTLIDDLNLPVECDASILHAFLWGRGIWKIGYDSEWGWDPDYDFGQDTPLGLSLTQFDKKGKRIEFGRHTRPGMPWVKAVLPHDIVVPYGTKEMDDAPWVAHRIVRHVDDIKADPKYSSKANLNPVMSMADFTRSYTTVQKAYRFGDTDSLSNTKNISETGKAEFCELYEIHDRRSGKIIVIATGHKTFLRKEDNLLAINGVPFVGLSFVPRTRNFWTTPDAYYLKQAQAELSDISNQATKQRRLSTVMFLYDEGLIDEAQLEKALSSNVGMAVKVQAGGRPLRDVITAVTPSNNNLALYQDGEYVRRAAREMVGLSRNNMGEFEAGRPPTATETLAVRESGGLRQSRRQAAVARFYVDLYKKLNPIISRLWTARRWVDLGADGWVDYSGSDLKGEYRYSVAFSEGAPPSIEARQARAMQELQLMAQDPMADQEAIRSNYIHAVNNPETANVFRSNQNANLPISMPQMQQGGGAQARNAG